MSKPRAIGWYLLAVVAPTMIVFWANACFVHNHFYVHGPYLHDSGWFSDIVYRRGLLPPNPDMVRGGIPYYYGWHISPLISLGSIASYAFPVDRVDYYALFQGAIYAPLAIAPALLVDGDSRSPLHGLATGATALLFAFGGQVLACIGYPHFEVLVAAGIGVMLAALATGKRALAWAGLVMAIVTREDGGYHAFLFLAAVYAAGRFGRPFPVSRRTIVTLAAVAFVSSTLMVFVQRKFFVGPKHLELYLIGTPPFAHINGPELVRRTKTLFSLAGYVWAPPLVAIAYAVVRRDWRVLLGFVVEVPWFFLNFLAKQELKSAFSIYTGFPFVGSIFWLGAYAYVADKATLRAGYVALGLTSAASLASTVGMYFSYPGATTNLFASFVAPTAPNPAGVRAFMRELRSGAHGDVKVDPRVASWTIEALPASAVVYAAELDPEAQPPDAVAFFAAGLSDGAVLTLTAHHGLRSCGRVPSTPIFFCGRRDRPLPRMLEPTSALLGAMRPAADGVRKLGPGYAVDAGAHELPRLYGPYARLAPGRYRVTWRTTFDRACSPDVVAARVEVFDFGRRMEGLDVHAGGAPPSITFDVTEEEAKTALFELRVFSGACAFVIDAIDVELAGAP